MDRAQKLREAALRNPFHNNLYESLIFNLKMLINIVLQYEEHLSMLAAEIDALAKEIEEYKIIQFNLSLVLEKRLRQQSFQRLAR
jgi:transposase